MPSWRYLLRNKRATVHPVGAASRLGDPSFEVKYSADVDWLAGLIPCVPRVVFQRYAGHEREMTAVSVGALTEGNARFPRGLELKKSDRVGPLSRSANNSVRQLPGRALARKIGSSRRSHTDRSPLRTSPARHARSVHCAGDGRIGIDNLLFVFSCKNLCRLRPTIATTGVH